VLAEVGGADMAVFYLAWEKARDFCTDTLMQLGVSAQEAAICAEGLVEASLRGIDSHGIASLPIYAERIHSGQMRPGMNIEVKSEAAAVLLCDGRHGLGPVVARQAMGRAIAKAAESGIGAVSMVNGNYVGALAPYALCAAERGMLGICAANSTPREEGALLPEGVLVDVAGRPSTNPQDLDEGALLPVGGALGYGIGLLVDLLCDGLNGGPCGSDVPPVSNLDAPYGCVFLLWLSTRHISVAAMS
jgi:LDH2 family malate/lactate/ureidoglycolate dehydrogenase